MFEGFNNWQYLILAIFGSCLVLVNVILAFKKKSKGEQILKLRKRTINSFIYLFLVIAAATLICNIVKKQDINKIIEDWFRITLNLNLFFTFGKRKMLTSIGIEDYVIKGYSLNDITWTSIKSWSIDIKGKDPSKSLFKYRYEHKGKRYTGDFEIFTDESENVKKIIEEYVEKP